MYHKDDDIRAQANLDQLKQLDKEIDIYYYKLDLLMQKQTQILQILQRIYERRHAKKLKLNPDEPIAEQLKASLQKQMELEILKQQLAEAMMESSDDDDEGIKQEEDDNFQGKVEQQQ